MQTVTIEIINNKASRLLENLELLQLIWVIREPQPLIATGWTSKYKGSLVKQL